MITVHQAEVIAAATDGGIVHLRCFNGFSSDLQRRRALAGYTSALSPGVRLLSRFDVQEQAGYDDDEVHCAACEEVIE